MPVTGSFDERVGWADEMQERGLVFSLFGENRDQQGQDQESDRAIDIVTQRHLVSYTESGVLEILSMFKH